ncbi:MAG TPA: RNA-splicing ligase RtcB, partial [Syntrophomonas sp.]|nr:RNA-splicing ligase RtcB [Syntrophomonas sp.]
MLELQGKYNTAQVFTSDIEETAERQIINLCNQEFVKGCKIRIMPDCHAGVGCVIGFTADLGDLVVPNLVGVDIGCGAYVVELGQVEIDLPQFDAVVRKHIPAGHEVHKKRIMRYPALRDLYCYKELKETERLERSIGTLVYTS